MDTTTTTYGVVGMTCDHCVRAVTDEVAAVAGVHDVSVELVPTGTSLVHVTGDDGISDAQVRGAIDEAGYELADTAS